MINKCVIVDVIFDLDQIDVPVKVGAEHVDLFCMSSGIVQWSVGPIPLLPICRSGRRITAFMHCAGWDSQHHLNRW
ncbi:MAG: hypothetical protein ACI8XD_000483 [Thermoproteota archaeon]|jgi:hypothetical protein